GHSLENQPFHLQWAWLSFKTDSYHGNETDGYINVTLQRRGYLGETSLVTVEVREKTASLGRDVSRQFAQMIQFNPGQTEKQWRLAIKDDNVFEGEETLTLQLTDSLSAVLKYPYVAMVTYNISFPTSGQTEKQWRLTIKDDNVFEGKETLTLQLTDPPS
ncbi:FREM2-like protein, partial [Mya arenaria]